MYETGTATGVVDLITKLEAFMETNGWTTDSFADEGTGKRLHAHNGSVYMNARAYDVETPSADLINVGSGCSSLAMNLSTAGSGGTRWFDKTGSPLGVDSKYVSVGVNGITSAIPSYHFFAQNSGDSILVVVEYASGYFQHFGFGTLNKLGSYTGGQYVFGSRHGTSDVITSGLCPGVGFFSTYGSGNNPPSLVSLSVDSETGWHWSDGYDNPSGRDSTKRWVRDNYQRYLSTLTVQPNSLNDLAVMMPVVVSVDRDVVGHNNALTHISPIGELPGVYQLRISDLLPGQQIVLGSDDYRVFPFFRKDNSSDTPSGTHSSYQGFAVKE